MNELAPLAAAVVVSLLARLVVGFAKKWLERRERIKWEVALPAGEVKTFYLAASASTEDLEKAVFEQMPSTQAPSYASMAH